MSTTDSRIAIERTRRHTRRWQIGGLLGGVIVAAALLTLGDRALGLGATIAPPVGGLVVVAAVCWGELTVRHAQSSTRTASPHARRLRDQLPRGPLALAITTLTLLAATLTLGTLMGDPDDLGRAGRALTVTCGSMSQSRGPWPGSFYALPIALASLASVVLAAMTCRIIVTRPAPGVVNARLDNTLRRWSARTVLLSLALAASATLAPVLTFMSFGASGMDCAPAWYGPLTAVSGIGAVVSALLVPALIAALILPPRTLTDGSTRATIPASGGAHL